MREGTFGLGADPNLVIFSHAFRTTARNVRTDVGVNRAAYTREYLEALVSREPMIASYSVAEIIENLNRYL